jgi:hypothetical protein
MVASDGGEDPPSFRVTKHVVQVADAVLGGIGREATLIQGMTAEFDL